jgi:hypothetical protein
VKLGNHESNLDIGKYFLNNEKDPRKAIIYFKRVKRTGWVSEAGRRSRTITPIGEKAFKGEKLKPAA